MACAQVEKLRGRAAPKTSLGFRAAKKSKKRPWRPFLALVRRYHPCNMSDYAPSPFFEKSAFNHLSQNSSKVSDSEEDHDHSTRSVGVSSVTVLSDTLHVPPMKPILPPKPRKPSLPKLVRLEG